MKVLLVLMVMVSGCSTLNARMLGGGLVGGGLVGGGIVATATHLGMSINSSASITNQANEMPAELRNDFHDKRMEEIWKGFAITAGISIVLSGFGYYLLTSNDNSETKQLENKIKGLENWILQTSQVVNKNRRLIIKFHSPKTPTK